MTPEQFISKLEGGEGKLRRMSMRGPLSEAARGVNKAIEGNFSRQESSTGAAWKPHAELTTQIHGPHELLRLSYDMFHASTDLDDPNAKRIINKQEIIFGIDGTELPYSIKQNYGEGRIPAREFFYLREEDAERVADRFYEPAMMAISSEVFG